MGSITGLGTKIPHPTFGGEWWGGVVNYKPSKTGLIINQKKKKKKKGEE